MCSIRRTPVLFLFWLLSIPAAAFAGSTLLRVIPAEGRMIATDDLGNVYLLRQDNSLTRFSIDGDSTAFYRSLFNGVISQIDPKNPLRILLFYPDQKKIVVLDRMLALKSQLDLRQYHSFMPGAIAATPEGNIYVYDYLDARLFQISENGARETLSGSNDLRQVLGFVPEINFMTLRDRRLYLADSTRGVFVFDNYGTYLQSLPLLGLTSFQVFGRQLVYRQGTDLVAYNLDDFREQRINLPAGNGTLIQSLLGRERLYLLYQDRLEIWRTDS